MLKYFIFIFLLLLAVMLQSCSNEQETNLSLDTELFKLHSKISDETPDSIYQEFSKALPLIENSPTVADSTKTKHYYLMGRYHRDKFSIDSAVYYFEKSTLVRDEIFHNYQRVAFRNLWDMHHNKKEFAACLSLAERYKSILDEKKDFFYMIEYYDWNSKIYLETGELELAEQNVAGRIKLLKKINNTNNIYAAYLQKASVKYEQGKVADCFYILDSLSATENFKKLSPNYLRHFNSEYAFYLNDQKQFKESITYFKNGLQYAKLTEEVVFKKRGYLVNLYNNIADSYLNLKDFKNSGIFLDSVQLTGYQNLDVNFIRSFFENKIKHATSIGDDVIASNYLDSLYQFQENQSKLLYDDQLKSFNKANEIEKELSKTQQEQKLEDAKQKVRLIIGTALLFTLLLSALYFYRLRKNSFEKAGLQMQQRLLRAQMNPHFTFNILYSIQNRMKKDPLKASEYLMVFSRLLRLILENSMSNYVLLEKEMDSLKKYLDLQLLRFPGKFSYQFNYVNLSEEDIVFIPPMLIQPIIENSIEHGFKGIDYKGEIILTLTQKDNHFIECKIEDNGRGISSVDEGNKQSASTKLIGEFLERSTKRKISVKDKKHAFGKGSGVEVKFLMPFRMSEND